MSGRQSGTSLDYDDLEDVIPTGTMIAMFSAVVAGVFLAVVALPQWAPELADSLVGRSPKAYWYISRTSAFASFALLWLSMALGLGITNRMARLWPGGPAAFELHQYTSLLGLNLALFHGLILLGDRYIGFELHHVLIPFRTVAYRPLWVGLGQVAFYLSILVGLSFYIRKQIGHRLWRWLHYLSFAAFGMAFLHGIQSGTDSGTTLGAGLYLVSGVSLLFLLVYRLLTQWVPVRVS